MKNVVKEIVVSRRALPSLALAVTVALLALVSAARADAPPATTTIRLNGSDFEGRPSYTLKWDAASNTLYRLQRRPSFDSNTTWETFDLARPSAAAGLFEVSPERGEAGVDPTHEFFRVLAPQPEIFSIEPALIGTNGGTIFLFGQCLGTNLEVRVGTNMVSLIPITGSSYQFVIPAGLLGEGAYDVEVLNGTNVLAIQSKLFSVTGQPTPVGAAAQRLAEPPSEPPASPMRTEGKKLYVGNLPFSAAEQRAVYLSKRGYDYYQSRKGYEYYQARSHVSAANGECVVTEEDLSVPGRGLDFVWTRTYRSRNGTNTSMGQNWDHSYNIYVSVQLNKVVVFGGNGQSSDFFPGSNGVYTANERFEEGTFSNGVFTLVFPDTGRWEFNSVSHAVAPGAISRIVDRNGNALALGYDSSNRLSQIVDTLGRTNVVAYSPGTSQLLSLTDFTGRQVVYTYYSAGERNGAVGDLKTVRSPLVLGTPNTNDFPNGKITTYTYTAGFPDERLNHNLTSIRDPKGQLQLQLGYYGTPEPADSKFDRIRLERHGENLPTAFTYVPQSPSASNSWAVMKTICNDGVGNVTIDWFDSLNRRLIHRDLAARATPGVQLAEDSLPTVKLRDTDPDFWETRFTWNLDSLCTRVRWPNGNSDECVYERDFSPACAARHKGDTRVMRQVACCDTDSDGDSLVTRMEYDPRFGSPSSGADVGGRLSFKPAADVVVSLASAAARGPRQTTSLDGSYNPKPAARGPRQTTSMERAKVVMDRDTGRSKGFRFVISATDPRGNVDTGQYDAQGNCVRLAHEGRLLDASDAPVSNFEYNSHGQLTACVRAADANGYRRRDEFSYDESGTQAGYLRTWTIDSTGPTTEITRYEYDAVGNRTAVVDPRGNTTRFVYNSLNQCVGTRELQCSGCVTIDSSFFYDASDNLVRMERDDRDFNGVANTNKPTWTTLYEHDLLNRCVAMATEISHPPGARFATNRFVYDANDNLIQSHSPEAVNGNQPANYVQHEYDTRDLAFRTTRAPGTVDSSTDRFDYDPNGHCVRETLGISGGGVGAVVRRRTFDGFDRCVAVSDPMGNVATFNYDANGNLIYQRTDGQTNDVPGSAGNQRLAETRYDYDSLNRRTRSHVSFFDIFTEVSLLDGEATTTFTYAPNGACRSVTDDNGHTTRYSYDTVGRLSMVADPKTNTVSYAYDPNDNIFTMTQSDSSDVTPTVQIFTTRYQYDALNRCVLNYDNVGNTNRYSYDSRGNCTRSSDANGNLTFTVFDGLSRALSVVHDLNADGLPNVVTDAVTRYWWDDNSRLYAVQDDNTNLTQYFYDGLDRLTETTHADDTIELLIWSPRSNLSSRTDANGTVVTYSYDDLDRCTRKDIAPGAGVAKTTTFEEFAFDGVSNLILATNDASMVEYSYNSLEAKEKAKADCIAMRMTHDGVGNRTSLTHPSGRVVTYGYDALDQITTFSTSAGGGPPSVTLATFAYDGPGRLARMTRGNGINTRWSWDGAANSKNAAGDFGWQQVSGINHQVAGGGPVIDRRIATYDRNQNKTLRQQTVPFPTGVPALTTNIFGYDALDRMTLFSRNRASAAYTKNHALDGNGNRQSVSSNGVVEVYSMDNGTPEPADFQMNQYTGTPFGFEQHDHNGNLVSLDTAAGSTHFTYDYANRLVSVERSAGPALVRLASFTYDALGRRISKTTYPPAPALPRTTQFLLDPETDQIIEERVDGVAQAFAVWPHMHQSATHVRISAGGEMLWVHTDELGSALALTDAGGNVLERYDYDDYGAPRFLTPEGLPMVDAEGRIVPQSPAGVHHLFRGMFWDGETGLYLQGSKPNKDYATDPYVETSQRYLDPKTGRNLTRGKRFTAELYVETTRVGGNAYTAAGDNPWSFDVQEGKKGLNAVNVKLARMMGGGGTDCNDTDYTQKSPRDSATGMASGRTYVPGKYGIELDGIMATGRGTKDWSNTGEWYKWRKAVLDGKVERKSMSVIFHNDAGEEAGRYNFFEAWPCRWKAPELNARGHHNIGQVTIVK